MGTIVLSSEIDLRAGLHTSARKAKGTTGWFTNLITAGQQINFHGNLLLRVTYILEARK
ncbi:hypothetical protein B0G75_12017 [Paraburkholderia sp. BL18I3N2]|nr:hypothetical protein [Paraburkholderia sp. BL18I3N2]PRX26060.1 hypothetical protein B0G75_12017 [Paraburkholderia sp. BL18I3N2]